MEQVDNWDVAETMALKNMLFFINKPQINFGLKMALIRAGKIYKELRDM